MGSFRNSKLNFPPQRIFGFTGTSISRNDQSLVLRPPGIVELKLGESVEYTAPFDRILNPPPHQGDEGPGYTAFVFTAPEKADPKQFVRGTVFGTHVWDLSHMRDITRK